MARQITLHLAGRPPATGGRRQPPCYCLNHVYHEMAVKGNRNHLRNWRSRRMLVLGGLRTWERTNMEAQRHVDEKLLAFFPDLIQVLFTAIVGALFTLMLLFGQPAA